MLFAAACLGVAGLIGCGGISAAANKPPSAPPPPPNVISVSAVASPSSLGQGQSANLTATVTNDTNAAGVTWSLAAGAAGTLTTVDVLHATYAPGAFTAPGTATVTATSIADPTKNASITIAYSLTWEGLVAFETGFERGVAKPYKDLERGAGSGVYQPDRMIFHEVALDGNGQPLNTEIWRLDNDSGASLMNDGVLNRTPWNANGSFFQLGANFCVVEVFCGDLHNYLYDAAGDLQQLIMPTVPASTDPASQIVNPLALVLGGYLPWDRFNPNLFYITNGAASFADGQTHEALYSVDVSNQFTVKKITDLPITNPGCSPTPTPCPNIASISKELQSYVSEDDVVMVDDTNPPIVTAPTPPAYVPYIFMVDVNLNRTATYGTIVDQFPINFSASAPGGLLTCPVAAVPVLPNPTSQQLQCPTHSVSEEYHFHDIFFQRDAGDHFIFNFGPKGSAGEGQFWVAPENGQASQVAPFYPLDSSTAAVPYMSHPAMNPDGTLVAYSGYDTLADQGGCCGLGNWVRSLSANNGAGGVAGSMGSQGAGHQGWDGYDPNYVVFDAYTGTPDANGNQLWSQMSDSPSDPDGTHTRVLVDVPRNSKTSISLLDGPSQSPDSTKMMFVLPENFTDPATQFSTYIAVDHRPFPPVLSVSSTAAGAVGLSWTPYLTHREIAGYHVYRSSDGKAFTELIGALNTGAFGSINATSFTDTTAQAGATYFYAVTAQEYSGLESNQLSNVLQVAVGGASSQSAAAGTTGWDATAPAAPSGLTVTKMSSPGEWKLTWQPSVGPGLRYYNVYYSASGPLPKITDPIAAQSYLIVSPPAQEISYIYWEASPSDTPVFGIVAVDRQDHLSPLACISTVSPSAPCSQ